MCAAEGRGSFSVSSHYIEREEGKLSMEIQLHLELEATIWTIMRKLMDEDNSYFPESSR